MRGTLWLFQYNIFMFPLIPYKSFSVSLTGCVYEGESVYSQRTQVVISLSAGRVIDYSVTDVRLAGRFMRLDHLFLPERDRRNCWTLSMQSSRTGRITLAHHASVSCISFSPLLTVPWLTDWMSELHMPMLMLRSVIKSCIRWPNLHTHSRVISNTELWSKQLENNRKVYYCVI